LSEPDNLVRLNKLLAQKGLCSRREADALIAKGLVLVNGTVADQMGVKVPPDSDLTLKSEGSAELEQRWVAILNKPRNYVSQLAEEGQLDAHVLLTRDRFQGDSATPLDHVMQTCHQAPLAGRLDRSSRGLLIFSTDGRVVREITQGGRWAKKYLVECTGPVSDEQLEKLNALRVLGEWKLKPMLVSRLGERRLRFELREGKKHQIREVCHAVDLDVSDLYRVSVGPIELGSLSEGRWRLLTEAEIEVLLQPSEHPSRDQGRRRRF
jgi:23S rRNA pseudouridine2604 synthase